MRKAHLDDLLVILAILALIGLGVYELLSGPCTVEVNRGDYFTRTCNDVNND